MLFGSFSHHGPYTQRRVTFLSGVVIGCATLNCGSYVEALIEQGLARSSAVMPPPVLEINLRTRRIDEPVERLVHCQMTCIMVSSRLHEGNSLYVPEVGAVNTQ